MEEWKERLIIEQSELKEKLLKLIRFINSDRFFALSEKYRQVLTNQRTGMEIYLSSLNTRLFEDVDNATIPNLGFLTMFTSIFTNGFGFPKTDEIKPLEEQANKNNDV